MRAFQAADRTACKGFYHVPKQQKKSTSESDMGSAFESELELLGFFVFVF